MGTRTYTGPVEDRSIGQILDDVGDHTRQLINAEVALAKEEVKDGIKDLIPVVILGAIAVALIAPITVLLGHALARLLDNVMDGSLAYLLTAIVFVVLAGVCGLLAKKRLETTSGVAPTRAVKRTKEDARWIATHARS